MTTTKILLNNLSSSADNTESEHELQYVPVKISYNGEEEISTYFTNLIKTDPEKKCLVGSFRGYPLEGEKIQLPKDYSLLVMQSGRGDGLSEREDSRSVRALKKLETFTYWNYDKVPSETDQLKKAFQWVDVAKAMHVEDSEDEDQKS